MILRDTHLPLPPALASDLRARLTGDLVLPGDMDYDAARKVWNGAYDDRQPAAIARCHTAADVQAALLAARDQHAEIAIRGGGHGFGGRSTGDGVFVIDVSPMKATRVHPDAHTIHAEAGLRLGEFIRSTVPFGLGVTTGVVSDTGMAGLTLGGGTGWLMGKYGLTIDNLLAIELVTADGQLLRASDEEHPDLFWALRGAGANFGIATAFTFQLHPVRQVLGGMLIHPIERAREMLRVYRDFSRVCPDELTVYAAMLTTPDGHPVAAMGVCYCGDLAEGERAIEPLRRFGPPVADLIHPMDLYELNCQLDEANPRGRSYYDKANSVMTLTDEAISGIVEAGEHLTSPFSTVLIQHMHGAATRVDPAATAFALRDETYFVAGIASWETGDPSPHVAWSRALYQALEPYSRHGTYVNFLSDEGDERIRASYGDSYQRLAALKNRYDPDNLFHLNQNIKPAQ